MPMSLAARNISPGVRQMTMTPSLRKLALTVHVASSLGWLGALAVFLAHAVVSYTSHDDQLVRAAWFVILPLSLTSFVTGLIQALGTAWGLFRHYWVLLKLIATSIATAVLLLKLSPISTLADAAARTTFSSASLAGLRASMLVHAAGGLLVLLATTVLALYKPQGLTPFGVRKQPDGDAASNAGTPRWVNAVWAGIALFLLVIIMLLHGGHGPESHMHG